MLLKGKLHCFAIGQMGQDLLQEESMFDARTSILFKMDREGCPSLKCHNALVLDLETELTWLELKLEPQGDELSCKW